MKTLMCIVIGMLLALDAASSLVLAQGNEPKASIAPRIRIGLVNYGILFQKYDRAISSKRLFLFPGLLDPLKDEVKPVRKTIEMLKNQLEKGSPSPEAAAKLQEQLAENVKVLETLDQKARKLSQAGQEHEVVELWTDIDKAIADHATKHDLDVVLGYGELQNADTKVFSNLNRKMNAIDSGGVVPVYIRNGADITNDVLVQLNQAYKTRKQSPAK